MKCPHLKCKMGIVAHPWFGGYSTSIYDCGVWGVRAGIQVSRREFHTHIHLDWTRVKLLSCIKKKKINAK